MEGEGVGGEGVMDKLDVSVGDKCGDELRDGVEVIEFVTVGVYEQLRVLIRDCVGGVSVNVRPRSAVGVTVGDPVGVEVSDLIGVLERDTENDAGWVGVRDVLSDGVPVFDGLSDFVGDMEEVRVGVVECFCVTVPVRERVPEWLTDCDPRTDAVEE